MSLLLALTGSAPTGVVGTADLTQNPESLSSSGVLPLTASTSVTESGETLSSSVQINLTSNGSVQKDPDTVNASGGTTLLANTTVAQAIQTVFGTGTAGGVIQDGRSGYWRLFFTQLQEESDKKVEKSRIIQPSETQPKPSPKTAVAKAEKRVIRPPEKVEKAHPFKPLPMREAKPDEPTYLQQMWSITHELRIMVASLQQSTVKFQQDLDTADEDDVELLLLMM